MEKWWYRLRDTGSCAAKPHISGPQRTLADCDEWIRAQVKKQPDVTLEELRESVSEKWGVSVSLSMLSRELTRLKLVRKKVAPRQSARDAAGDGAAAGVPPTDPDGIGPSGQTLEIPG